MKVPPGKIYERNDFLRFINVVRPRRCEYQYLHSRCAYRCILDLEKNKKVAVLKGLSISFYKIYLIAGPGSVFRVSNNSVNLSNVDSPGSNCIFFLSFQLYILDIILNLVLSEHVAFTFQYRHGKWPFWLGYGGIFPSHTPRYHNPQIKVP
jgi:hypothetical protein